MIKMVQKQDIITLRRREMSLRAIARELKLNRATVTKVVREFEASRQAEDPGAALEDVLATKPSRTRTVMSVSGSRRRVKTPVMRITPFGSPTKSLKQV